MKIDCSLAVNYLKEMTRVCDANVNDCSKCEVSDACGEESKNPQKLVDAVQQWSDAHPQKTYLEDLLELYPNAWIEDGRPTFCPKNIGLRELACLKIDSDLCRKCWNQIMEDSK